MGHPGQRHGLKTPKVGHNQEKSCQGAKKSVWGLQLRKAFVARLGFDHSPDGNFKASVARLRLEFSCSPDGNSGPKKSLFSEGCSPYGNSGPKKSICRKAEIGVFLFSTWKI